MAAVHEGDPVIAEESFRSKSVPWFREGSKLDHTKDGNYISDLKGTPKASNYAGGEVPPSGVSHETPAGAYVMHVGARSVVTDLPPNFTGASDVAARGHSHRTTRVRTTGFAVVIQQQQQQPQARSPQQTNRRSSTAATAHKPGPGGTVTADRFVLSASTARYRGKGSNHRWAARSVAWWARSQVSHAAAQLLATATAVRRLQSTAATTVAATAAAAAGRVVRGAHTGHYTAGPRFAAPRRNGHTRQRGWQFAWHGIVRTAADAARSEPARRRLESTMVARGYGRRFVQQCWLAATGRYVERSAATAGACRRITVRDRKRW